MIWEAARICFYASCLAWLALKAPTFMGSLLRAAVNVSKPNACGFGTADPVRLFRLQSREKLKNMSSEMCHSHRNLTRILFCQLALIAVPILGSLVLSVMFENNRRKSAPNAPHIYGEGRGATT